MATYPLTMASQKSKQGKERKAMASGYISKNDFIRAYQWTYGTSKKEAEYIWSIASYEYKVEIIRGYTDICKKSFYHD